MKHLALAFVIASLVGCASSPKLYPNAKYNEVGKDGAEKDIEVCEELAEAHLESEKGKQVAKGAGQGAVVGAAVGAVSGLFTGGLGRSALFGGAVGATAGGASAALSPSQLRRNFVNKCLEDRGYQVLGWQ